MLVWLALMAIAVATALFAISCFPSGREPPTAEILSPEDGATVSGIVTVGSHATDDYWVYGVECSVDDESVTMQRISGDKTDGMWEGDWDTTAIVGGCYTITVTVTDSGRRTALDSIDVLVENPGLGSAQVQLKATVSQCPGPCPPCP